MRPGLDLRPAEAYAFFGCAGGLLRRWRGSRLYLAKSSLLKVSKCFLFFSFCFSLQRGLVRRACSPQWIVKIGERTRNWQPIRNISYTWNVKDGLLIIGKKKNGVELKRPSFSKGCVKAVLFNWQFKRNVEHSFMTPQKIILIFYVVCLLFYLYSTTLWVVYVRDLIKCPGRYKINGNN